jgi:hypothetical protein
MSEPQTPTRIIRIKTSESLTNSGIGRSCISIFALPVRAKVFMYLFMAIILFLIPTVNFHRKIFLPAPVTGETPSAG